MNPIDSVAKLLKRCGAGGAILPPTALFNEGWMLRLVLEWAALHPSAIGALRFDEGSRWYSEALLGSRFRPRRRGDVAGEGFTHADGVIGHFRLRPGNRGDIELLPGARQLVIIEAKMASGLSLGTKRAPDFNQAARNVACMAHLLSGTGCDPMAVTTLGFVVLAPAARIAEGAFATVDKVAIQLAVEHRAKGFDVEASDWSERSFKPVLARCQVGTVAWETVLNEVRAVDAIAGEQLGEFYSKCLLYNPLRPVQTAL